MLITITLLFILLVDNGLQAAGVGGLILSLIPPLAVFGIGIFVKKNSTIVSTFLGEAQNTSTNDGGSGDEDVEAQRVLVNEPQNTSINNGCDSGDGDGERRPLLAPRP